MRSAVLALALGWLLTVALPAQPGAPITFGDVYLPNVMACEWNGAPALVAWQPITGSLATFDPFLNGQFPGASFELRIEAVMAWVSGPCAPGAFLEMGSYSHAIKNQRRDFNIEGNGEGWYCGIPDSDWPAMRYLNHPGGTSYFLTSNGCAWSGPEPFVIAVVLTATLR